MRFYIEWYKWECYNNGMWRSLPKEDEEDMLKKAIDFTGDYKRYGEAMNKVIWEWENSMLHFLSNPSINKKAYIGHCATQHAINCPEYITRQAWKFLTDEQRFLADKEAWECYLKFKQKKIKNNLQLSIDFYNLAL